MGNIKEYKKNLAKEIRSLKAQSREFYHNGETYEGNKYRLKALDLRRKFRIGHVVQCRLKGIPYNKIENKVRDGNKIYQYELDSFIVKMEIPTVVKLYD